MPLKENRIYADELEKEVLNSRRMKVIK